MIDVHVHIDKGNLSFEWINQFVNKAIEKGINEIYLLQHTNVFSEFMPIYEEVKNYNEYQYSWVLEKEKNAVSISQYIDFIANIKKHKSPIKIKFGLEVCYSEKYEKLIKDIVNSYNFDFLTGSVHTIDGWAFSHLKQHWAKDDVDVIHIYYRYYEIMLNLVKSEIFNGLAHPDSLACFGVEPVSELKDKYILLADAHKPEDVGAFIEDMKEMLLN